MSVAFPVDPPAPNPHPAAGRTASAARRATRRRLIRPSPCSGRPTPCRRAWRAALSLPAPGHGEPRCRRCPSWRSRCRGAPSRPGRRRPCPGRRSRERSRSALHPAPRPRAAAPRASAGSFPTLQRAPEPRYPLAVAQPAPGPERAAQVGRAGGPGAAADLVDPAAVAPLALAGDRASRTARRVARPARRTPVVADPSFSWVAASTDSGVAAATRQRRRPTLTVRFLSPTSRRRAARGPCRPPSRRPWPRRGRRSGDTRPGDVISGGAPHRTRNLTRCRAMVERVVDRVGVEHVAPARQPRRQQVAPVRPVTDLERVLLAAACA